jgi:hypothetical protein
MTLPDGADVAGSQLGQPPVLLVELLGDVNILLLADRGERQPRVVDDALGGVGEGVGTWRVWSILVS